MFTTVLSVAFETAFCLQQLDHDILLLLSYGQANALRHSRKVVAVRGSSESSSSDGGSNSSSQQYPQLAALLWCLTAAAAAFAAAC